MRRIKDTTGDLGPQIRAAREAAEMTQAELAEATGIDQGQISRIEAGTIRPTIGTLCRLADALAASFAYDGQRTTFCRR